MSDQLDAICAVCDGSTDVGGECNSCDFDWENDSRTEKQKYVDEWSRLSRSKASKEDHADFLRHNKYGRKVNYSPYCL